MERQMAATFPEFYRPEAVGDVFIERAGVVAEAAQAWRRERGARPASEDRLRTAAFGIDCQVAFCTPGASLFVPGAGEDMRRAVEWIYRHLDRLTTLVFSLDTHGVHQIFHPSAWVDRAGRHPAPFSVLA